MKTTKIGNHLMINDGLNEMAANAVEHIMLHISSGTRKIYYSHEF